MSHRPLVYLSTSLLTLAALAAGACNPGNDPEASATENPGPTSESEDPGGTGDDPTTSGTTTTTTTTTTTDAGTEPPAETCGNGQIDGAEACDGGDLGGKQCSDIDPAFTGTLTCAPDCMSLDASDCMMEVLPAQVSLNEVTSKSATQGPWADKGDAIELINSGGAPADLSGWKLSDDPTFPVDKTYVFPQDTTLAAGAILVLVEFDPMTGEGNLPFGVSSMAQETLTLTDAGGGMMDELTVQGPDAAVSYCRLPDGTGAWQLCDQTLGALNQPASMICGNATLETGEICDAAELGGQDCTDLGFTGGTLACTGACALDASMCQSASKVTINELEVVDDRIELHNAGNQTIDITGWILTDDPVGEGYDPDADLEKMIFPAQTTVAAGQFIVINKGDVPGEHPFGLAADGDTVTLLRPDLTPISQVTYGGDPTVVAHCRLPDGPTGQWTADCKPTLGAKNKAP